jgi:hypothetical protein
MGKAAAAHTFSTAPLPHLGMRSASEVGLMSQVVIDRSFSRVRTVQAGFG